VVSTCRDSCTQLRIKNTFAVYNNMEFTLSVLSALALAAPVLATELAKPLDVTFVSDWGDASYSGQNIDTTSMTEAEIAQLPDMRFTRTGEPASINIQRAVWNDLYHYKVSPVPFLVETQTDVPQCVVEVDKDPGGLNDQILLSGGDDEFNYKVGHFDKEVTVKCDKVVGPVKL
jgi:hypothetical protein